ncbi:MAG: acyl dehydratase [Chitinophagales bacterium]|jgi:acyl dehydratase
MFQIQIYFLILGLFMLEVVAKEKLADYIGKELEAGDWFTITQDQVNTFADATLDHQFIHIDEEKAKETPFGGTIAHGFLTLSMLVHLTENCSIVPENIVMGVNYGFDKVRFINPVRVGSEVRAKVTIADVTHKDGGQILIKQAISVEIKGQDKPALIGEWLLMYVVA